MQKNIVVFFGAMIACALWGSAFPCIKIGYQLFQVPAEGSASQLLFAGFRFFLAGVLVLAFKSITDQKLALPGKQDAYKVVVLAFFQTILQYIFFYIGLAHAMGVKSSIIQPSNIFFSILFAGLLFKQEKITAKKIIGSVIGFAGVVLINLNGASLDFSFALNGELFILFSCAAGALSAVLIKDYGKTSDPVILSGSQFVLGGFVLVIVGYFMGGKLNPVGFRSYVLLIYMALISAVAYTVWSILLKYNPVSKVTVFGFMNPIFGVLLSALLLGEKTEAFSLKGLLSLVLVCIGIFIVNYAKE